MIFFFGVIFFNEVSIGIWWVKEVIKFVVVVWFKWKYFFIVWRGFLKIFVIKVVIGNVFVNVMVMVFVVCIFVLMFFISGISIMLVIVLMEIVVSLIIVIILIVFLKRWNNWMMELVYCYNLKVIIVDKRFGIRRFWFIMMMLRFVYNLLVKYLIGIVYSLIKMFFVKYGWFFFLMMFRVMGIVKIIVGFIIVFKNIYENSLVCGFFVIFLVSVYFFILMVKMVFVKDEGLVLIVV